MAVVNPQLRNSSVPTKEKVLSVYTSEDEVSGIEPLSEVSDSRENNQDRNFPGRVQPSGTLLTICCVNHESLWHPSCPECPVMPRALNSLN